MCMRSKSFQVVTDKTLVSLHAKSQRAELVSTAVSTAQLNYEFMLMLFSALNHGSFV